MSNNCITHHHACDCREAYFKRIEEWALEAREVLRSVITCWDMDTSEEQRKDRDIKILECWRKFPSEAVPKQSEGSGEK